MVPFQHGEVVGRGEGHEWAEGGSHNPTWCDLCGELIWGLYDTGTGVPVQVSVGTVGTSQMGKDPDLIIIQLGLWIRIQVGRNNLQNKKK